ncbi:HAD family hydrolase [Photobacterium aphoticum]|nr:HAD hydrolase-like protein [Photobacterium aphoticum]GHA33603.1 hydrolase [Photobacterium aphoticum]
MANMPISRSSSKPFTQQPVIIFDLDGTISDPKVGIVRCMNHALKAHGYPTRDEAEISRYIGPPLDLTFQTLVKSDDPVLVASLVATYRDRYATEGYAENTLYDGMVEVIKALAEHYPLAVCTSKRRDFAEMILARFDLLPYFQFVNGGEIGVQKTQQLSALLHQGDIDARAIMIGDRNVDLIAAHNNGLRAIGVLWGYGDEAELSQENPAEIVGSPEALTTAIRKLAAYIE